MFNTKIKITAFFLSFIILLIGNLVIITDIITDESAQDKEIIIGEKNILQASAYSQKSSGNEFSETNSETAPEAESSVSENYSNLSSSESQQADNEDHAIASDNSDSENEDLYSEGLYVIGQDMPAGIYKLTAAESQAAFYRISKNIDEDYSNITDNDVFNTVSYILVNKGEYLNLVDASAVPLEKSTSSAFNNSKDSRGKYLVGKDIIAATYNVIPNGKSGYIEIAASPIKSLSDIIFSRTIKEKIQITLLEGQYVKLTSAFIETVN